jgi:hypothetical protein
MKKPKEPLVGRGEEGGVSRRDLVRALGLSAGGAALFGGSLLTGGTVHAATTGLVRTHAVALVLDNLGTFLEFAEGGNALASVVLEPPSGEPTLRKRTGAVRHEDLQIQVGFPMAPPLASWISETMTKGPARRSGALVYLDGNLQEVKRLEFTGALLTEIGLPACDASVTTKPFIVTLVLAPTSTRLVGPGGPPVTYQPVASKQAMANLFRLNIQGLEPACKMVGTVSAISAKRLQPAGDGESKPDERSAAPLDCSIVTITLPEKDAAPFHAWFSDFVIKGNNGRDGERPGRLEWTTVSLASVVTVDLGNLGIVRYAPAAYRSSESSSLPRVAIDMYCESWNLRAS